jgi:hypothetical protein
MFQVGIASSAWVAVPCGQESGAPFRARGFSARVGVQRIHEVPVLGKIPGR